MIHIAKDEQRKFTVLFVEPSANKPLPTDLQVLKFPDVNPKKGLVIVLQLSPLHRWFGWVMGSAIAHYEKLPDVEFCTDRTDKEADRILKTKMIAEAKPGTIAPRWVGVYDCSLSSAVVISSHLEKLQPGNVIEVRFRDMLTGEAVRKGASVPYAWKNVTKAPHKQGSRSQKKENSSENVAIG